MNTPLFDGLTDQDTTSLFIEKEEAISIESSPQFLLSKEENIPWWFFFTSFFSNPKEIGAFFPSSKGLARKMVKGVKEHIKALAGETFSVSENFDIDSHSNYKILELGGGSGVFTEEMIRQGIPEKSIFLVERQEKFVSILEKKFANSCIMNGFAQDLLKKYPAFEKKFPVVISGIPLRNISNPQERQEIFNVVFRCIKEGGFLRQFTYGISSPIASEELRKVEQDLGCIIEVEYEGKIFKNFPPARIYKYAVKAQNSKDKIR
jgi:phospholipid N-methyltransferase